MSDFTDWWILPLKEVILDEILFEFYWILKTTCDLLSFKVVIINYELLCV